MVSKIKTIDFYIHDLTIDGSKDNFVNYLDELTNENTKPVKIDQKICKINQFQKIKFSDRFFGLYVESGDLSNYCDTVIDIEAGNNLKKMNNPRKKTQLELNKQFFYLIDTNAQRIYISHIKGKEFITELLENEINKEVILQPIYSEEKFSKNLIKLSKISFTFTDDWPLFRDTLTNQLTKDLYGYGAESMSVSFKYNKKITRKMRDKFTKLMRGKYSYKNLKIIGKDDKDTDLIFNLDKILSKIPIKQELDDITEKLIEKDLFKKLISKIIEND